MGKVVTRICPKCKHGILYSNELDKANWDRPAICGTCGKGFIRWNIFYWPLLPFLDGVTIVLGGLMLGTSGVLCALALAAFLYYVVKVTKLNQKYGIIINSPNNEA